MHRELRPVFKRAIVISLWLLLSASGHALASGDPVAGVLLKPANGDETGVRALRIRVLADDVVQVLGLPAAGAPEPLSLVVEGPQFPQAELDVTEDEEKILLSTRSLELTVDRKTGQVHFRDKQGKLLLAEGDRSLSPAVVSSEDVHHVGQSFRWQDGEALYGLGQHQEGHYNWRGRYAELVQFNRRAVVPVLLSTKGYGLFWDNYSYTRFDDTHGAGQLWSEVGDAVNYYFIHGPDADAVIGRYRQLTGQAPMFPKWAFGFIQSKERYENQDEVLAVAREYRERKIPMDVIVQDWRYWKEGHWGQKSFDSRRYPDPAGMMKTLHEEYNARLMISVWPKMGRDTADYAEMAANPGFLYFPETREPFYDAFNPAARDLYWKQANEGIFSHGVDAWWCDATEPEVDGWDFNIDGYKRNMKPMIGSGARYMNAYSLMHSKGMYENQRRTTDSKRVVNLTRSAFAGQQKYATITWSGDINATWEVFRAQIPAGLNFSMSGLPYWTMDIGGFFVRSAAVGKLGNGLWFREGGYDGGVEDDAYKELYVRWFQYGAFCPIFRTHGTDIEREVWAFGEPGDWAYDALLQADRLRYRLMPYIYSQAWQVTDAGYTLMRGLAMDFPDDSRVHSLADQYLFGPSLMVNPVTRPGPGGAHRRVYLPRGADWYNFWTGKRYTGGQTLQVPAPIDQVPLFVKAGAILPLGPAIQYASESSDPIELRIYQGADGRFLLYEDENDGYGYEQGRYATIEVRWNDAEKSLTLEAREGSFPGMPEERTFRIVRVSQENGAGPGVTEVPDKTIQYLGTQQVIEFSRTNPQ